APSSMEKLSFIEGSSGRSGRTFLVPQQRTGFVNGHQAFPAHSQAEVHIIVIVRKGRIHSIHPIEDRFPNADAGARYSCHVSRERQPWPEFRTVESQSTAYMAGAIAHGNNHASM